MDHSRWSQFVASHQNWDQLDEQICITWLQGASDEQIATGFKAVLEDLAGGRTGGIMERATDIFSTDPAPGMLVRSYGDWTIVLEVTSARGRSRKRLQELASTGQGFFAAWDINWNSNAGYVKDGRLIQGFAPYDIGSPPEPDEYTTEEEIRRYTDVIAWSESLGVSEQAWKDNFKAACLSIGERLSGVPITEDWIVENSWTLVRFQKVASTTS